METENFNINNSAYTNFNIFSENANQTANPESGYAYSMWGTVYTDTKKYINQNGTAWGTSKPDAKWTTKSYSFSSANALNIWKADSGSSGWLQNGQYICVGYDASTGTSKAGKTLSPRKFFQSGDSSDSVGTITQHEIIYTPNIYNNTGSTANFMELIPDIGVAKFYDSSSNLLGSTYFDAMFGASRIIYFPSSSNVYFTKYVVTTETTSYSKTFTESNKWYTTPCRSTIVATLYNNTDKYVSVSITSTWYSYYEESSSSGSVASCTILPYSYQTVTIANPGNGQTHSSKIQLSYSEKPSVTISGDDTNALASYYNCSASSASLANINSNYFSYNISSASTITYTFTRKNTNTSDWLIYGKQYSDAISTSVSAEASKAVTLTAGQTLNVTSTSKILGPALFPIIQESYSTPPHNYVTWYVNDTKLSAYASGTDYYYLGYTLPLLSDYATSTKLNSFNIKCSAASSSNGLLLEIDSKKYCIPSGFTLAQTTLVSKTASTYAKVTQAYTYTPTITVNTTNKLTINNIKYYKNGTTTNGTPSDVAINMKITSNGVTATNSISAGSTSNTATYNYQSGVACTIRFEVSGDYYFCYKIGSSTVNNVAQYYETTIAADTTSPTITLPSALYYKTKKLTLPIKKVDNTEASTTSSYETVVVDGTTITPTYPYEMDRSIVGHYSETCTIKASSPCHYVGGLGVGAYRYYGLSYTSPSQPILNQDYPENQSAEVWNIITYKTVYMDTTSDLSTGDCFVQDTTSERRDFLWTYEGSTRTVKVFNQNQTDAKGNSSSKDLLYKYNDIFYHANKGPMYAVRKIANASTNWSTITNAGFHVGFTKDDSEWLSNGTWLYLPVKYTETENEYDAHLTGQIFNQSTNSSPNFGFIFTGKEYQPTNSISWYETYYLRPCSSFTLSNISSFYIKAECNDGIIPSGLAEAAYVEFEDDGSFYAPINGAMKFTITNNTTKTKKIIGKNSSSSNADSFTAILKAGESTTWTTTGADGGSITAEDVPCNVYVKVNDNWILGTSVYVKENGEWKQSTSPAYAKVSGTWKTQ